jgi:hypothetical protein
MAEASGGVGKAGLGSEEVGTGACAAEEEDDGIGVVAAALHGGRRLGDELFLSVTLERTGMESGMA